MNAEEERWTTGTMQIISEKHSIEDITLSLNIEPTRFFSNEFLYSKKNPKDKPREANLWILASTLGDQVPIESHIEYFLSILEKRADAIKCLRKECEFGIACSYSSVSGQGGFTIDNELLKVLTAYPIDLNISLYPPNILSC